MKTTRHKAKLETLQGGEGWRQVLDEQGKPVVFMLSYDEISWLNQGMKGTYRVIKD